MGAKMHQIVREGVLRRGDYLWWIENGRVYRANVMRNVLKGRYVTARIVHRYRLEFPPQHESFEGEDMVRMLHYAYFMENRGWGYARRFGLHLHLIATPDERAFTADNEIPPEDDPYNTAQEQEFYGKPVIERHRDYRYIYFPDDDVDAIRLLTYPRSDQIVNV